MGKASKDRRDIYYRLAKEQGWRARSAFKLLAIDDHFHILDGCRRIVDLCAAPGSWSQVLSKRLIITANDDATLNTSTADDAPIILAVDLMQLAPINGVTCLQADITNPMTASNIVDMFAGQRAQLVLCDGAPDVINMLDWDEFIQAQLVLAALDLALAVLEPGGTFVSKVYRTKIIIQVYGRLLKHFDDVQCAKPRCCRDSSLEAFVVCRGFHSTAVEVSTAHATIVDGAALALLVPFVVCGDSRYDSDRTYPTHIDGAAYEYLPPVQGPLSAPYQELYDRRERDRAKEAAAKASRF